MPMNWNAIGAIGQIVGAVAVVMSLVYLALQSRQGARASLAQTELEATRMWSELHARVAHSPDMARIWDSGHTKPEGMSEQDRQRFIWLVAEYFFLVEGLFNQHAQDFLSPGTWSPHQRTIAGLLENPIVLEWWRRRVSPYSEDFVRHVDGLIEQPLPSTWAYTPLAELSGASVERVGRPGQAARWQVADRPVSLDLPGLPEAGFGRPSMKTGAHLLARARHVTGRRPAFRGAPPGSGTFQKSEVEGYEHEDDPHVDRQTLPEAVPEEQDIDHDDQDYHRAQVQCGDRPPSHFSLR